LIDGALICNNPALFAYQHAKYLKGKQNIRLLSIGTGTATYTKKQEKEEMLEKYEISTHVDLFAYYVD
jgi:hypothetical protein